MAAKLKIDDLTRSEALDREAMSRISGGGRAGQPTLASAHLKRRFRDTGSKGWATRFRTSAR